MERLRSLAREIEHLRQELQTYFVPEGNFSEEDVRVLSHKLDNLIVQYTRTTSDKCISNKVENHK
ncbi:MAG: aspartyl-phosphate phosphatase Spo0E family protein [Bacillota bacterium]